MAGKARLPDRPFFLSFDDGFREMSEQVAPICRTYGVPATFFLTTGYLGNQVLGYRHKVSVLISRLRKASPATQQALADALSHAVGRDESQATVRDLLLAVTWRKQAVLDDCADILEVDFEEYLRRYRPYLTHDQVRRLLSEGFSIGGHSVDHPLYSELTPEEQVRQTELCMQELRKCFSIDYGAFAFPFVCDGVQESFYDTIISRRIADLIFCIGTPPARFAGRTVERFGVESRVDQSLHQLIHREAERRLRQKISSFKRSLAPQL